MNNIKAKNLFCLLAKNKQSNKTKFFLKIIDFLYLNNNQNKSIANEFEFSFVEKKLSIRILHLNFPKPSMLLSEEAKRKKMILSLFKKIGREFETSYNTQICNSLFDFNRNYGCWPIQFGFEHIQDIAPKLKVYLSINSKHFSIKKFCDFFKLSSKSLSPLFVGKKFDAIAIDFLPNNNYFIKIYTISRNKGKLFRIDDKSQVKSIKQYWRFPAGIDINKIDKKFVFRIDEKVVNFIVKNDSKIHYFCVEGKRKSIYLR